MCESFPTFAVDEAVCCPGSLLHVPLSWRQLYSGGAAWVDETINTIIGRRNFATECRYSPVCPVEG